MHTLKTDHLYLYKRVLVKAVVHMLFGLILLYFPAQAPSLSYTPLLALLGVNIIGACFLLIGLVLLIGIFKPEKNYKLAKIGMWCAALFNISIFISLFAVLFQSRTTACLLVIYGYMTYNIYNLAKDPGWRAIQLIKNIKQDATDIRQARTDGASAQEIREMDHDARLHQ